MTLILEAVKKALTEGEASVNLREAATLTGSGSGVGGRVIFDDAFAALRYTNPLRGMAREVPVNGSDVQFVAKVGNAASQTNPFGYTFTHNTGTPSTATSIWQIPMRVITAQLPIRTAALDDINALDETIVADLAAEFGAIEGASMVGNNDQSGSTTTTLGGTEGLRGLNYYPSASTAAYGTSGTALTNGLHSIATVTQAGAAIAFTDITSIASSLPAQYWTSPSVAWHMHPNTIMSIRNLKNTTNVPIYIEVHEPDGGVRAYMYGFPVIPNPYMDVVGSGKFPIYLAAWNQFLTIADGETMTIKRYDQTAPGFVTLFAEKRVVSSVRDVFAGVRLTAA